MRLHSLICDYITFNFEGLDVNDFEKKYKGSKRFQQNIRLKSSTCFSMQTK